MPRLVSEVTQTIEQRLAAWVAIHDRQGVGIGPRVRPSLTISREFGCEAFPLAVRLKDAFDASTGEDWTIFDRSLIERVAHDEEIAPRILRRLGDVPRTLDAVGLHPEGIGLSQEAVYQKIARCLVPIARHGNAIIIGRGGAVLCQDLRNCFHFRLVASLEWRVRSYAERLGIPLDEARRTVVELSEMRTRFLSRNLATNVADPKYYDAIFSNERHSIDDVARAIVAYVRGAWTERDLFKQANP